MSEMQEIVTWFVGSQAVGLLAVATIAFRLHESARERHGRDVMEHVENRIRALPTDDDISRIHARIDEVAGAIKRLEGETGAQSHTLHLIHEYLLNHGERK